MEWQLFADLAEDAGERRVTVDVEPGATVEEALEALLEAHPSLEPAVREDGYASVLHNGRSLGPGERDVATEPGDELALLPPVSGG